MKINWKWESCLRKEFGKNHWNQPYKTELSIYNFRTNLGPKIEKDK